MRSTLSYLFLSVLFAFVLSACGHHRHHAEGDGHKCSSCDHKAEGMGGQCKAGEAHATCEMCKTGNCPDCKKGTCEKCKAAGCTGCKEGKCDKCDHAKCDHCKEGKCSDSLKKSSSTTDTTGGAHSASVTKGKLGDVDFHFRSNTYFAGALTPAAVTAAKAEKVTTIINLQTPNEITWDEKKAVETAGLTYYNFPVEKTGSTYDTKVLAQIEETYMKHHKKGEKVVVHCTSGGRAASWFAYHIKTTHKDPADTAVEQAKEVGLVKDIEKVKKTLAQ